MATVTKPGITIGMGVTAHAGNDSYPFEVVAIKTDKKLIIRSMEYRHVSGNFMEGNAVYTYHQQPNVPTRAIRLGKRGWKDANGNPFSLGKMRYYQDPSS